MPTLTFSSGGSELPSGIIVIWKGLVANIPSGWVLCDGTAGTPDLRAKFIKGASSGDEGTSGGSATHQHTAAGSHTHDAHVLSGSTGSEASHTHSVTAAGTISAIAATATAAVKIGTGAASAAAQTHTHPAPTFTGSAVTSGAGSSHLHGAGTLAVATHASDGSHTHDAVSNEPVYYKLCFIMKT